MKEIEISEDIIVCLQEINDGEAVIITEEEHGEVTEQIILLKPLALAVARKIIELVGEEEDEEEQQED